MQVQHLQTKYLVGITCILLSTSLVSASTSIGTIDSSSHYARICHDVSCSTYGTLNFLPTSTSTPVSITDSAITGYIWGDEIGWVNLAPTGAGVTVDFNTGILYGTAFSQTAGWINFKPTNGGVTINNNGELNGYAWVGGLYGGWIKFDCSSPNTCVKTDWRTVSLRTTATPTSTGGGYSSPTVTVSANATTSSSLVASSTKTTTSGNVVVTTATDATKTASHVEVTTSDVVPVSSNGSASGSQTASGSSNSSGNSSTETSAATFNSGKSVTIVNTAVTASSTKKIGFFTPMIHRVQSFVEVVVKSVGSFWSRVVGFFKK